MDPQELLTAPASSLTRKQRRDRADLKRQLAATLNLPPGHAVGTVRCRGSLPGIEQTVVDEPIHRAITQGKVQPGSVIVRMLDEAPFSIGRP